MTAVARVEGAPSLTEVALVGATSSSPGMGLPAAAAALTKSGVKLGSKDAMIWYVRC